MCVQLQCRKKTSFVIAIRFFIQFMQVNMPCCIKDILLPQSKGSGDKSSLPGDCIFWVGEVIYLHFKITCVPKEKTFCFLFYSFKAYTVCTCFVPQVCFGNTLSCGHVNKARLFEQRERPTETLNVNVYQQQPVSLLISTRYYCHSALF